MELETKSLICTVCSFMVTCITLYNKILVFTMTENVSATFGSSMTCRQIPVDFSETSAFFWQQQQHSYTYCNYSCIFCSEKLYQKVIRLRHASSVCSPWRLQNKKQWPAALYIHAVEYDTIDYCINRRRFDLILTRIIRLYRNEKSYLSLQTIFDISKAST